MPSISELTCGISQSNHTDLTIRSLHWSAKNRNKILVGTKESSVIEVVVNGDEEKSREWVIMEGHAEGELWALACHSSIFVTGSDDCTVRWLWWFVVVYGGLLWFVVAYGSLWWLVVACGGFLELLVVFGDLR